MLFPGLHTLAGHGPNLAIKIKFRPSRADGFAGTRDGEDRKFKCERRDAVPFAQFDHEGGKLRVWNRLVISGFLALLRKKLVKVPGPCCGVVAAAELVYFRRVKNASN